MILKESHEVLLSIFVSVKCACFSFPYLLASLLLRPGQMLLPLAVCVWFEEVLIPLFHACQLFVNKCFLCLTLSGLFVDCLILPFLHTLRKNAFIEVTCQDCQVKSIKQEVYARIFLNS